MKISTFRAASLQEALQRVREELGPDASVLHMRELTERAGGQDARPVVEVDASLDLNVDSRFEATEPSSNPSVDPSVEPSESNSVPARLIEESPERSAGQPSGRPADLNFESSSDPQFNTQHGYRFGAVGESGAAQGEQQPEILSFRAYVNENKPEWSANEFGSGLKPTSGEGSKPPTADSSKFKNVEAEQSQDTSPRRTPQSEELGRLLARQGFPQQAAKSLLEQALAKCTSEQLNDTSLLQVSLIEVVTQQIRTGGGIELDENEPTVVAFVGPTGAGKTTTLAKVATNFRMDVGCQVGLVTMDTFRLGAVDQLLHYAEHLSAQLEVISSPEQLEPALLRLRECDLVLLDTPGRSTSDREQLSMLGELLEAAQPDSTHLVLSADRSVRAAQEALDRFSDVSASHVVVSKLDEAIEFGSWWKLFESSRLPVSYLTTGQRMPNDLVPATGRRIAQAMLGLS